MADSMAVPHSKSVKMKGFKTYGEKIKVAIIGCGWIAESHVDCYRKMPDVEIIALADLIPGKAKAFNQKYGLNANCYLSHTELLANEQPEIVSVCTYNMTHAECSIAAMRAGAHVLCEKPMCVTLEEAVEMTRVSHETGKKLSIGFQPRMDNNFKKIKEIVQSGDLGKVYYVQTGGGRPHGIPTPFGTTFIDDDTAGIGAVGDIGCYSLDLVLSALGYPKPVTVSGFTSDYFGKNPEYYPRHPEYADIFSVDDFAAAFIRFENGLVIDFRIAWAMNLDTPGDTIFMGTKASLRVPSTECWNGSLNKRLRLIKVSNRTGLKTVKKFRKLRSGGDVFFRKVRGFIEAVRENKPCSAPPEEIIYNQAIIDGIVRSAKLGHEVEIVIPDID